MRPTRESSEAGYLFSPIWSCSGGVYPATPVTRSAVSSYLTVSPLPRSHRPKTEKPRRFVFCGTFVLGSLLLGVTQAPCPVEPGISSSLSERVQNGPRPSLRLPSRFMIEPVLILVTLYCNNRIRLTIPGSFDHSSGLSRARLARWSAKAFLARGTWRTRNSFSRLEM